ncbi:hypothetical protein LTR65_007421 [Meristemomyces frigidus]
MGLFVLVEAVWVLVEGLFVLDHEEDDPLAVVGAIEAELEDRLADGEVLAVDEVGTGDAELPLVMAGEDEVSDVEEELPPVVGNVDMVVLELSELATVLELELSEVRESTEVVDPATAVLEEDPSSTVLEVAEALDVPVIELLSEVVDATTTVLEEDPSSTVLELVEVSDVAEIELLSEVVDPTTTMAEDVLEDKLDTFCIHVAPTTADVPEIELYRSHSVRVNVTPMHSSLSSQLAMHESTVGTSRLVMVPMMVPEYPMSQFTV